MKVDILERKPLRVGVIGAGRIAQNAIAPAIHRAVNVDFVAAASRDVKRAELLKPLRAYDSYDALLSDPDVEMVFITTHNGLHCDLAIEAMRRRAETESTYVQAEGLIVEVEGYEGEDGTILVSNGRAESEGLGVAHLLYCIAAVGSDGVVRFDDWGYATADEARHALSGWKRAVAARSSDSP